MKLKTNKVNILGTEWTIIDDSDLNNPKLINKYAYAENYEKKIVYESMQERYNTVERLDECQKEVLRHEIIHAFFYESGLNDYGKDEVLVDYIATQFYKLDNIFKKLGIEKGEK